MVYSGRLIINNLPCSSCLVTATSAFQTTEPAGDLKRFKCNSDEKMSLKNIEYQWMWF